MKIFCYQCIDIYFLIGLGGRVYTWVIAESLIDQIKDVVSETSFQ